MNTSESYKAAIAADTELTKFEADFSFIPEGALEGATASSDNEYEISRVAELLNGNDTMPKYATLENNRWRGDGSFILINPGDTTRQIGWWSEIMSDEDGTFSPVPIMTCILDKAYDLIGVALAFDPEGEEWATNVTVSYYDTASVLISSAAFTGISALQSIDFPCLGVKKIQVIINAWNLPGRRVKMSGFLPGQKFVFDPSNTFSFDFSEQINPFETNIKLPEYTITFDNSSRKFDIVNPSGLMYFLRQRMKIPARIGVKANGWEYISMGNMYVAEWPDDSQEDSAQLTCRPYISFASGYYEHTGRGTQTVAQAVARIWEIAGMDAPYIIDPTISAVLVNQYIGERVPLINAMGQLAVASGGYWKFERDGSYHLKRWSMPAAMSEINYDGAWSKPGIHQDDAVTSVNVKYCTWNTSDERMDDFDNIVSIEGVGEMIEINSAFVPSASRANDIAVLALDYYAMRLSYSGDYRGDPSIEAGDVVEVENDYESQDVLITEHRITWTVDEKLSGSYKGRGVS